MKKIVVIVILIFSGSVLFAQVTEVEKTLKAVETDTISGWKKGGNIAVNFGQTTLVNWAAGGQNTVAVNGLLNLFGNYYKNNISWVNSLDLAYGIIRQGKVNSALWVKTDDRIDLVSKAGYKIKENAYFAALYQFRTQFAPGYSTPAQTDLISNFAAPAYSLLALGLDYKSTSNVWSVFLAPLTLKTTIVTDQNLSNVGAFGVEPGQVIRNEFGGYLRFQYKKDLIENVNLETKLDLFSNYLNNPQNIDVNWQVLIAMKINKYLSANLTTHLIYDDDIKIGVDTNNDGTPDVFGPRTQFKEVFGVGFSYKF
jgi:hypothetical protein